MQAAATRTRLFVETGLRAGAAVELTGGQAHYLQRVVRLAIGDEVLLFNGSDGEWRARIEVLKKDAAALSPLAQTRAQADGPDLWLVFAPIKRASIDFLAQKATELGVSALAPVLTKLTMIKRVNTGRLRANAIEAAEQSGRLDVPEVREPVAFERLLADWPDGRRLMLCDESGAGAPIAEALGKHGRRSGPWAVLVGPEGGFEAAELDALRKLPFVTPVALGARLMRADTAALAALACWQALVGDWHAVPGAAPDGGI